MKRMLVVMMLISSLAFGQIAPDRTSRDDNDEQAATSSPRRDQIEPNAGNWRTWVISSGKDYRVPPPPGRKVGRASCRERV